MTPKDKPKKRGIAEESPETNADGGLDDPLEKHIRRLMWISEVYRGSANERRRYEVRFLLAALTLFVLAGAAFLTGQIPTPSDGWLDTVVWIAFPTLAMITSLYLGGIHLSNNTDSSMARWAEDEILRIVAPLPDVGPKAPPQMKPTELRLLSISSWITFMRRVFRDTNYSWRFQTMVLIWLAVIVALAITLATGSSAQTPSPPIDGQERGVGINWWHPPNWTPVILLVSATAAWVAVRRARRGREADFLWQIFCTYAKDGMSNDLRVLRDHICDSDSVPSHKVDEARRRVKMFFLNAYKLREQEYINDKALEKILDVDGVQLLKSKVLPLERLLNPKSLDIKTLEEIVERAPENRLNSSEITGSEAGNERNS